MGLNIKDRFLKKVKTNSLNDCWEWQAAINNEGYGVFGIGNKIYRAHRASYIIFVDKIPENKWVLHKCDNRRCVNPDHLYIGTRQQNVLDMLDRNRSAKGEKHSQNRFSEEFVLKLRSEFDNKRGSIIKLAKKYKILPQTVRKIVKRLRWTHI